MASIIVDGVFQGNFLVQAKGSQTIKRGGMKKESFVFVSHDKEWLKRHTHLPPLTNDEFIGEIIVNVRPLWIRRPQRDTRFRRMLLNQKNNSTTAERPVFGSPNVYRVIQNTEPQSSVLQDHQEKAFYYCDGRPHTALGGDSGQRFFCGLGPLTRGCHSFLYTLKKGTPHRNTPYHEKIDDNGKKYE